MRRLVCSEPLRIFWNEYGAGWETRRNGSRKRDFPLKAGSALESWRRKAAGRLERARRAAGAICRNLAALREALADRKAGAETLERHRKTHL